jgi:hypothetical protein
VYVFEHMCLAFVRNWYLLTVVKNQFKTLNNRLIRRLARVLIELWQYAKQQNAGVMRTTRLFLSIALVALTATSFGRIADNNNRRDYNTVEMIVEQGLDMESWMTIPFENSDLESDLDLEHWMAVPFEIGDENRDLCLENWMSVPFETNSIENDLCLENWMTIPFETTQENEAEQWMTQSSS